MQKLVVFILLFSIVAKPLYVGSVYGNYFLDVDGFIEKYCVNKKKVELKCNGKCELAKQLNSSTKNNSNPEQAIVNASDSFVMVYFKAFTESKLQTVFTFIKTVTSKMVSQLKTQPFNSLIDHPPEFL